MGGEFAFFSRPHHVDFVCASCPTVEHLPPPENKMSNARQMPWGGDGAGLIITYFCQQMESYTPYSQMAANLGRARGQTWNRGVLG